MGTPEAGVYRFAVGEAGSRVVKHSLVRRGGRLADGEVGGPPFSALLCERRGIPVVVACGEIDLATVGMLRVAIEQAAARANGPPRMVVDLREVSFMDVTCLGLLIERGGALRQLGGNLWLVAGRQGAAARLLGLTGLDEKFRLHPDCESAVGDIERGT